MVKKKGTWRQNFKKGIKAKQTSKTESTNSEITSPGLGSVHQPVFMKVCRLCETKDGPFLNIFDADKVITKKIEAVMPFRIEENDDLPHKICFRCSAKLEELYEFIQKCIKTQDHLQTVLGKKGPLVKVKHRELWEEKLNQSNISNDDICKALIKKAMEGIKDINYNPTPLQDVLKNNNSKILNVNEDDQNVGDNETQKMKGNKIKTNDKKKTNLKDTKNDDLENNKTNNETNETPFTRSLRSCNETNPNESEIEVTKSKNASKQDKKVKNSLNNKLEDNKNTQEKEKLLTNTFSLNDTTPKPEPLFNIMDHISTIKVNGVGVLFQCKLCNRNFLKKQVVMSHACAKNGPSKIEGPKPVIPQEHPKISTVKYINTKLVEDKKPNREVKTNVANDKPIDLDDDDDVPLVIKKPKPRIGPASKVRRNNNSDEPASIPPPEVTVLPMTNTSAPDPIIEFPKLPSLNSRYKLMAGPNNTYTLVEEKFDNSLQSQPKPDSDMNKNNCLKFVSKPLEKNPVEQTFQSENRPYPVGLFKTLPHNSSMTEPLHRDPDVFTTPAMKKQSYTVVQTGNPSKLLISSKPQAIVEEIPKKRLRKTKHETKKDESNKQPFSVTLEDTAPPRDAGFFTFINVDPLLQPSYVLPTDNIIQESQISTSTNVSKQTMGKDSELNYTCNMCNEKFTREKKLLAHIQSHYSKMDEEDQIRTDKTGRKRRK